MIYKKANIEDAILIYNIVQETIKTIYPLFYNEGIVLFFLKLHSLENIVNDISKSHVGILEVDGIIVGTGCYSENHITRVYVLPKYQKLGYGTYIMKCLEEKINEYYDYANLDSSLPAHKLYEHLGYKTIKKEIHEINSKTSLNYDIMEKRLK